jgi:hypothetical protein
MPSSWVGPPLSLAGGLMATSVPVNYVDGNFLSTFDSSPYTETRGRLNFVLLQNQIYSFQSTVRVQQTALPRNYIFTDPNQTAVPTQLTDVDLSTIFNHKVENGDDWGIFASAGSDSNIPFNSIFEMDWQVTGVYHDKVDALHSWLFFLNYSPTRSFAPGVPLPGVGYLVINPENHTQIFLGLPFFIGWQPSSEWNLSLSYFIPTSIDVEASRKISAESKIHFNFQWANELWLIANRSDNQQHLILDEKKLVLGLRCSFLENFFADFSGGFIFDQTLLLGHSITDRNMPNIELPPGLLAQVEIAAKF